MKLMLGCLVSETVNNTPVARLTPPGSWPSLDDRDSPSPDAPAFGPMTPRTPRAVRVVPPMTPMSPEQKLERTKKRAAMIEEKWMHGTVLSSLLFHDIFIVTIFHRRWG